MAYGYNPYGGYGVPAQMAYAQPAPQQAYAQQMQAMSQMAPQQMQTQPNVITRMVTSREEATTAQIQFDNTINVFINLASDEVYIKRFNPNTGGAWFGDYIPPARAQQIAQEAAKPQPEYVTMDQFTERLSGIEGRMSELADTIGNKRKRGASDE